jgi:DNA-binding SARP family transcriptional activator/WD40 repeat protein
VGIALLGPLSVDGNPVPTAPRDRMVLGALALRLGDVVSAERLADALWGERPPASWKQVVQGCVVRLRKLLGPGAIETVPQGYRLVVARDEVDACRFERLVARARELLTLGEPERAAYVIGEALALWRGRALADLEGWGPGRTEAARLEELRLDAEELRLDAVMRAGRHREVLAEAESRVAEAPLREQRWALLALAQYQTGQQGDALRTLYRARAVLASELGVDPGPDLVVLEQAILQQDPALAPVTVASEPSAACPYLGLVHYGVDDADLFFGRDADVAQCVRRLADAGVVTVIGPSGSGKSSLVRAGIAAALGREGRRVVVVAPGAHPMDALTWSSTSGPAPVLIVDQCEEALTLCQDTGERVRFFAALVAHAERAPLVVAMRADRVGDVSLYPEFARLVERGLYLLAAMDGTELRAAIEVPAHQAGLLLEPGLVDLLVRDIEREPGALPLLSHALRQAWERREGRTLTVAGYRETGGIRGAVAQSAEEIYEHAPPQQRPMLRDLLLRLVAPSPDGEPVPARLPRRLVATDPEHDRLIELLVGARLVTSDDGTVELAHEALARAWPRLRGWLDDDVEGQRILRHLTMAADTWDAMARPDSELYRGVRLAQAFDWRERTHPDLTPTEQAFLDVSQTAAETERRTAEVRAHQQARANRRLRALLAGGALLLVIALIAAGVAVEQRGDARDRARVADAARLAEQARGLPTNEAGLALLLALEARRLEPSDATDGAVEAALADVAPGIDRLVAVPTAGNSLPLLGVSPDGRLLAAPTATGDVQLIELASGRRVRTLASSRRGAALNVVSFAPDARSVIGGSGNGVVRIWDVRTGRRRGPLLRAGDGAAWGVFDPADATQVLTVNADGIVRWDVSTQDRPVRVGPTLVLPPEPTGFIVHTSGDGRLVAAGGISNARTFVWDADSGSLLAEFSGFPGPFTQDGSALALVHPDRIEFVDVETGAVQGPVIGGFTNAAGIVLSPDGRRVAVGDIADYRVRVFDRQSDQQIAPPLTYFTGISLPVRFLDHERLLVAGSGEAIVWRYADATPPLATLLCCHTGVALARFTPDGSEVVTTGGGDDRVLRWRARDGRPLGALLDDPRSPRGAGPFGGSVAFSSDGDIVAVGHADGTVDFWNRTARRLLTSLSTGQGGGLIRVDWSPTAPMLATTAPDRSVVLWDVSDLHRPTALARVQAGDDPGETSNFPTFSPDGQIVVAANSGFLGATLTFIDVADGRLLRQLHRGDNLGDVAFSTDSRTLAVGGGLGVALIDVASGETIATRATDGTSSIAFANGGRWLVTVGWPTEALGQLIPQGSTFDPTTPPSATLQLRDAESLRPIGEPITVVGPFPFDASANLDGTKVVTNEFVVSNSPVDTAPILWELDPERWAELACDIAGRNLTRDEWADYLPGRDHRITCPQWPADT